ncbi:DUF305 domain-containing protein [Georgenia muralis]
MSEPNPPGAATDPPPTGPPPAAPTGQPPAPPALPGLSGGVVVGLALVLLALATVIGVIAGSRLAADPDLPGAGSVDAGFARDMGAHHAQAVQMSVLVRDRSDDVEIRALALDILLTQQQQAGQMFGWLELWGLPQTSERPRMAWMQDHAGMAQPSSGSTGTMPGMATQDQLNELAASTGREAERLYLQLMVPHHQGGVAMATYAADRSQEPAVRELAASIVRSQTTELTVLTDLLAARS